MAGESYQKIEIPLDSGMVSNQSPATGDPATLLESKNTRHVSSPRGTVERQPTPASFTNITTSGVPVSLIPLGNEVALVNKSHLEAHGANTATLWRRDSESSSSAPAQKWSPLTATGGGVAWSAAPNQFPMAAEFCQRAGFLVGAVTYLEQNKDYPYSGAPRSEYVRTLLRVLNPETGAPVIEDIELRASSHSASTPNTNSVIGAVPITNAAGTATKVAVWYTYYDDSGASQYWWYRYRVVTIADGAVTVGTDTLAWNENVTADSLKISLAAVTQSCEAPTRYTYIGRRNTTSGKAELVRWDHDTDMQSWATQTTTAVSIGAGYLGYGYHGFGGPWHTIDVAAEGSYVAMAFRYDEGGGTESVRVLSCTEAGALSQDGVQVLPTTTTAGVDFYFRLGITHHTETSGESWAVTATNDGHLTTISNQLPTATPHQFCVVTGLISGGVVTMGSQMRYHAHTSERPFTAWDSTADSTLRASPFVPIMRSPRAYDAENPLGQKGLIAPQNNAGSIEEDPALEIHSLHIVPDLTTDRGRIQPSCRIGVDRSIPATTTHSGGDKEPGRDHRRAKPLSEDGQVFAVAYLADREVLNNTPRSVRYAVVDAGHAPRYAETPYGLTYVAAGTVWTWDGTQMLEGTPISVPRLRAEEFDAGADPLKYQNGVEYYFNAIYMFRDDAGVIHRSRPNPNNLAHTITSSGAARLKIFVELPPSSLDGKGLRFIGAEIYGASNASALVLGNRPESGLPIEPVQEQYGELEYRSQGPDIEFNGASAAAWWQGGELEPSCPASMLDIEHVNDRLWGIRGEDGVPMYSKPYTEGHTFEWSPLQTVPMQSAQRAVAVSEIAGKPLIFTQRDAWTVFGEGPNRNGGGSFSTPQRVANVGAVSERLVLKTPAGVVFKGRGGSWYMIGGDYSLSMWGEEVRDLLETAFCLTYWWDHDEVRVGRRDSSGTAQESLVWNWRADKWSLSSDTYARDFVAAGDQLYALHTNALWYGFTTTDQARAVSLTTPWVRPAGLEGDARALECVFTARRLLTHGVSINVWTDYNEMDATTFTWSSAEVDAAGPASGGHYSLQFTLPSPSARAFKFQIIETSGANGDAVFHPLALTMAVRAKPNLWQQYLGKK